MAIRFGLGAYIGYPGAGFDTTLTQFTDLLGEAPSYIDTYVDYTQPASDWVSGSKAEAALLAAGAGTSITPVVGLPMGVKGSGLTSLQNFNLINSGALDSVYINIIKAYQAQGFTSMDVRIGWEMNGNWQPWAITDAADAAAYVTAYQHITDLVRSVSGISVQTIWNPDITGYTAMPTESTYPGNNYVDIIGLDMYSNVYIGNLYDWSTHKIDSSVAQWEANPVNLEHIWDYPGGNSSLPTGGVIGSFGLIAALNFAAAQGKPVAFPEAGAGGDGTYGNPIDNPLFTQYLASRLLAPGAPPVAFVAPFDEDGDVFTNGAEPNIAAGWAEFVKKMNQGDSGPSAVAGSVVVGHGLTTNIGAQVASLITPGQPGDTETVTAVTVLNGAVALGGGGAIDYTAGGSGADTLTYTVEDQLGDVATFTDAIVVDTGPTEAASTSLTVAHGQGLNLASQLVGLVTPGVAGDTETVTAIKAARGAVSLGSGGAVNYTPPASGTDSLTYTVTDQAGDHATFTTAIAVDPGPQLAAGGSSVVEGTTVRLGPAMAALITPGVAGASESITAVSAARGTATLGAGGAISYAAPTATGPDTLTYTVVDQYGATATATYAIDVIPVPASVAGTVYFFAPGGPAAGTAETGVTVSLLDAAGDVVSTLVTSKGYFQFRNVSPGTYQLQYSPPVGEVVAAGGKVDVLTDTTAAFTLTPGQSYFEGQEHDVPAAGISGSVLLGGGGAAGVVVSVVNAAGAVVATTATGSDGSFAFTALDAGAYQVLYTPPQGDGLVSGGPADVSTGLSAPVTLVAGQSVSLAPETLAVVTPMLDGRVLYAGAGEGGVGVALLNAAGTVVATSATASDGWFSFGGVASGSYEVQYTAPSGQVLQSGPADPSTGLTAPVALTVGRLVYLAAETVSGVTGTLAGSVADGGGGEGGVAVALLNASGTSIATTSTADDGSFSFSGLGAGDYALQYTAPAGEVLAPGSLADPATGETAAVAVAAGQVVNVGTETLISAPASVSGSVVYGGAGQAGVSVALLDAAGNTVASAITASGGGFSFTGLTAGAYELQYSPPAGEDFATGSLADPGTGQTATFTLTAGQALNVGVETFIDAAASLTGSVVYGGAGAAGVAVALLDANGDSLATTATADDGSFSFTGLAAGSYQVQYTAPGGEALEAGSLADPGTGDSPAVTLVAGQSLDVGTETLVAASTADIAGSVVYAGAGQGGVTISLVNSAGTVVAVTTTASDGSFGFSALAVGSYQVEYTAPFGEVLAAGPANTTTGLTATEALVAGQTLTLGAETLANAAATGEIEGVIHHYGSADPVWGTSQSGVTVELLNAAGVVVATTVDDGASGWFALRPVPVGTYELEYILPAGEAFRAGGPADVTTGITQPIVITGQGNQTIATQGVVSSSNDFALNGAGAVALRGDGSYVVTGTASGGELVLGDGADSVTLTGGTNAVTVGDGNQVISLAGTGNTVTTGDGKDTVTVSGGASTVTMGDGNEVIALAGTGNTVTVGAGVSVIHAGTGGDAVHSAGGWTAIFAGGSGNVFDAGGIGFLYADGSANNTFMLNAAGQGLTTITGFNPANSDLLDLQRTLAGVSVAPDLSNIGTYVTSAVSGGSTLLFVNTPAGGGAPVEFAVLKGVTTSVSQLLSAKDFSLA